MAGKRRHRTFEVVQREKEPVEFTLAYRVGDQSQSQDFTCSAEPPQGAVLDLVASEDGDKGLTQTGLIRFIRSCLLDEDRPRFDELIRSATIMVDAGTLLDVYNFLMEEYTARPTEPPSDSSDGRSSTTDTSREGAPLRVLETPEG